MRLRSAVEVYFLISYHPSFRGRWWIDFCFNYNILTILLKSRFLQHCIVISLTLLTQNLKIYIVNFLQSVLLFIYLFFNLFVFTEVTDFWSASRQWQSRCNICLYDIQKRNICINKENPLKTGKKNAYEILIFLIGNCSLRSCQREESTFINSEM